MHEIAIINFFGQLWKFQVYKVLVEKTKKIPGAKVENNKFCLSVHFRCVEEKVLIIIFYFI